MLFNNLFKEWKDEYNIYPFIKDGIVDEHQYKNILFILREANTQEEIDLRTFLKNGGDYHSWNNITRWIIALTDENESYPKDITVNQRRKQLAKAAIININKQGGHSKTNRNLLLQTVKKQYHYIYEEIYMCNPDIIICCGLSSKKHPSVASLLKFYILSFSDEWQSIRSSSLNRKWYYYYTYMNNKKIPVISFVHPQLTRLSHFSGHEKLHKALYEDMKKVISLIK